MNASAPVTTTARRLYLVVVRRLTPVLVPLLIVAAIGGGCAVEDDGSGDGFTAEVMCEEFVKDRLKSPATAEFSEQAHRADGAAWVVSGVVDSENGFGALVRSDYTCELRRVSDDEWQADAVNLSQR